MSETEIRDLFGKLTADYEKNLAAQVAAVITEHEKQRIENAWTNKAKTFIVKHFSTILICVLLFWSFGGGNVVKNYAAGGERKRTRKRILPENRYEEFRRKARMDCSPSVYGTGCTKEPAENTGNLEIQHSTII